MDEQKQDKQPEPQLCTGTGCSLKDLSEAMDDRDRWRERMREIRAGGMT